jgi:hypothetical protein
MADSSIALRQFSTKNPKITTFCGNHWGDKCLLLLNDGRNAVATAARHKKIRTLIVRRTLGDEN